MRTVPANLRSNYYKLKKSRLILKNEIDSDSMSYFEIALNKALPKTEYELNIYYFLKNLYYSDKQNYYNFINNTNYECLVLYTDNTSIVKHFGLLHKVYIKWNKEEKKYIVSEYVENGYV
jgi:hypothetical protein